MPAPMFAPAPRGVATPVPRPATPRRRPASVMAHPQSLRSSGQRIARNRRAARDFLQHLPERRARAERLTLRPAWRPAHATPDRSHGVALS